MPSCACSMKIVCHFGSNTTKIVCVCVFPDSLAHASWRLAKVARPKNLLMIAWQLPIVSMEDTDFTANYSPLVVKTLHCKPKTKDIFLQSKYRASLMPLTCYKMCLSATANAKQKVHLLLLFEGKLLYFSQFDYCLGSVCRKVSIFHVTAAICYGPKQSKNGAVPISLPATTYG